MSKVAALIALTFALAACMRIEAVRLEHPETGRVVICGPYSGLTGYNFAATAAIQRGCVEDFKEQGYVRVP